MEDLKPGWLDEGFVKQVLGSVEDVSEDLICVYKWHCNAAVPPGSNYLSLLYRLSVDYKIRDDQRSISLIVKTPLETGPLKEFMEKANGYVKELRIYDEVLPRMYEIYKSRTVTPRSYVCTLHNSLVLEDLGELGYKMADRLKQLDLAHCEQFLISLARFHGMSVALYQKDPEVIESLGNSTWFREDIPEEDFKMQEQFTNNNLTRMVSAVKSLGLDRYAEIIHGKIGSYFNSMQQIFKHHGPLRVLNHGDCWTSNALFKYDDSGNVTDAKLVDFQMIRTGSFAQDIFHFWCTSANQEVRESSQEKMFEVYRKSLNQTLEELQLSERVSKDEFDKEIRRVSPYALCVCSSMLTVVMADPDDLLDFSKVSDDDFEKPPDFDSPLSKNFRSKYYKAILPDLLRQLERFGVLG